MAKQLTNSENHPTHEEIANRAYSLFEQSGKLAGHDQENWFKAEEQLMAERRHSGAERANGRMSSGKPAARQHLGVRQDPVADFRERERVSGEPGNAGTWSIPMTGLPANRRFLPVTRASAPARVRGSKTPNP